MHQQLVVEAKDDAGAMGCEARPHRCRPRLEQLGGGALHDGVAGVATAGGVGRPFGARVVNQVLGVPHAHQPAAERAHVAPGPPVVVGITQILHRHRVRGLERAERLAGVA